MVLSIPYKSLSRDNGSVKSEKGPVKRIIVLSIPYGDLSKKKVLSI